MIMSNYDKNAGAAPRVKSQGEIQPFDYSCLFILHNVNAEKIYHNLRKAYYSLKRRTHKGGKRKPIIIHSCSTEEDKTFAVLISTG